MYVIRHLNAPERSSIRRMLASSLNDIMQRFCDFILAFFLVSETRPFLMQRRRIMQPSGPRMCFLEGIVDERFYQPVENPESSKIDLQQSH